MNWLVKWGVKKYVLSIANTALNEYAENVSKARETVTRYIKKVEAVLEFLKSLDKKISDDTIDDNEVDTIIDEAVWLGQELVK